MFQVSESFKHAAIQPVQEHRISGTIGNISFSENNIVDGTFSITNQSTDTSDVVLGSCYVGQLNAEFVGIEIPYGNWINKTITPTFELKTGENTWESVPLGVFKVKEAKHTAYGVQVVAYDNMIKFDKKFKKSHFKHVSRLYSIINIICTDCGVTLGMTQQQIEALPNGNADTIKIYGSQDKKSEFANDIATYRDLLFWCAQTMGCFATINRSGALEFRQYTQNIALEISDQYRIDGATFADYITHYIGIYVENLNDNTEDYYGYDTAAITAEIAETEDEIDDDTARISELEDDLIEWQRKLDNHECTQQEYDEAVATIDAELTPLKKEVKQLTKRLSWLNHALEQAGDDGADMVLGANPLLMDSNLTNRDNQRRAVLDSLNAISYTPFNASVVCGVVFDLGDVIQFSGGLYNASNDSFGCVMQYTYTHNGGTELEGFGVDPSIPMVRTKSQKTAKRANKNSVDATKNSVGIVDPSNPSTPDEAVDGKNGDMYVQETHKTEKKEVARVFDTWDCHSDIKNNLHWYSYARMKVSSDSGAIVSCEARVNLSGNTWCVAGSVVRKISQTFFIVKVPAGDPAPVISAEIYDVSEYNTDDRDKGEGGWGQQSAGTTFYYNQGHITNTANTYDYYYASCAGGSFTGGLRYETSEENQPDYVFESVADMNAALAADQVQVPVIYDGEDGNKVYYNDGTGGNQAWKEIEAVRGIDTSDEAGGTENNGLTVSETTQKLSLKKNVVRAWYKADPPQAVRNFSQLCVRYTGKPDNAITIEPYASHHWGNIKIEKDAEGVYKIKCGGTKVANELNYAVYQISGLTIGKKYYFNFCCDFANNATFNYDPNKGCGIVFNTSGTLSTGDWSGDGDKWYSATKYYAFKRQTNSWYADFDFEAEQSTMYMCVVATAITDNIDTSITLSEFVLSQNERELIRNIYLYDYKSKVWLKYRPIGGAVSSGDEGGGSVVTIAPLYSQGTKIANYTIDGIEGSLYAPNLPIASASQLGGIKVGENLTIDAETGVLSAQAGGVTDYDDLTDKPQINGVTLASDKTTRDLGMIQELTQAQYNALPSADKQNPDKVYYIKDAGGGGGGGGGGGASAISDLTDVDLSNLSNGQILKYNSTSQKWENASESTGGGYTETSLFTGDTTTTSGEITLSDNISNYDQLCIWVRWNTTTAAGEVPFMVNAKYFHDTFLYNSGSTATSSPHLFCFLYSTQYLRIKCGSSDNKLLLFDSHSGAVSKVIGINY